MTDKTRIRIAAAATALFLAGISTVGLAARSDNPQKTAQPAAAAAAVQAPTTVETSIAASARPSTEDERYEDEAEPSNDEQEGYDDKRYEGFEDHD
jgi:hypothetical protein